MDDLLIHTSDVKVDVLRPSKIYDPPCICFSFNQFISHFGEYIYLFNKSTLEKNFHVEKISSRGLGAYSTINIGPQQKEFRFQSIDLGYEYRVYNSIDVNKYGLGVITQFNHLKGVLETKMGERVIREFIDLSNGASLR